ncbi:4Fe-4S binding protein [Aneurinibacillus terranovensis]|uniref:4Fe-4S binding protein n=1 Tax=Aneurinibacillus terranovensis TaxID=278991 RepID=UPI000426B5D4|nr:4Fe-4S binding protein [Aneurinibacillus terranovensis]
MNKRSIFRSCILLLFFLVPLLNIFRIDLLSNHFFMFGSEFAFSEGRILLYAILLIVYSFVAIAVWFGRQFCGWACPHNKFLIHLNRILSLPVFQKHPVLKTIVDTVILLICAPVITFGVIAYFYDPAQLLSYIIHFDLSAWTFRAFLTISVFFFILLNSRLRYKFCRVSCPYGIFQMALSDKHSRKDGCKNMVRGSGLILTVVMLVLVSLFTWTISANTGFAISLGKNLQNVPVQNYIIYTYNLNVENLTGKPASYSISYSGIPTAWKTDLPKRIDTKPHSTADIPLLFRVDQGSIDTNTKITLSIKNDSGKVMERQFCIFPVKS